MHKPRALAGGGGSKPPYLSDQYWQPQQYSEVSISEVFRSEIVALVLTMSDPYLGVFTLPLGADRYLNATSSIPLQY